MLNLQRLMIFAAVVEAGSFTAAATALGLTKAVVSFNIKQLEIDLGVSLLVRNTRRLSLTDTGERFYPRCLRLLEEAENMLESVQQDHAGLSGILRITSTSEFGALVVVPALAAFSRQHPQLRIQYVSSSYHADLIAERFDIAIRLGQLADSSLRAAPIDSFAILPVAAPEWLAEHPIKNLAQLAQAAWLAHSRLSAPLSWQVMTPEQGPVLFKVESPPVIMADSATALLAFALQGSGVALLPDWLVRPALERGELSVLLPDHQFPNQSIYALYPNTRRVPEKVRVFIDFLQARVANNS
ncbi:LysR family transcriptional regulator [Yersinia hibernica]|uniref:LysR family transcriptional regulator n=1 Tax=Yersinia hibernica TaxID=2339259 RepID=A0ABX5R529_9GAMM|nr:LysR family transcriptional regulator [Yersinia hibernica]QAX80250.1 LysR family transcriptional regulator [Yersinia hibernica]